MTNFTKNAKLIPSILLLSGTSGTGSDTLLEKKNDIILQALEWNPQSSRRGRPKNTWKKISLRDSETSGKSWDKIKIFANDRIS